MARRELNNYEIRPGRLLGVCCSVTPPPSSWRPQDSSAGEPGEIAKAAGGLGLAVIAYAQRGRR